MRVHGRTLGALFEDDQIDERDKPLVKEDFPAVGAIRQDDVTGSPIDRSRFKREKAGLTALVFDEGYPAAAAQLPRGVPTTLSRQP